MSKPLTKRKLDDAIAQSFKVHGDRVQFNMMDLGKLDRDVRAAYANACASGATGAPALTALDAAMVAAVAKYRVDGGAS